MGGGGGVGADGHALARAGRVSFYVDVYMYVCVMDSDNKHTRVPPPFFPPFYI